jgi:c-di-GMP-binding flagellar brake protein YcgR
MTVNNAFEVADFSPYQVHSRREIIALLRSLEERKQLVSLLLDSGAETVVTSILQVNETDNMVVIDCAPNTLLNQLIAASDNISFESVLDNIRILFFVSRIEPCSYDGKPALRFALPASMIRLQRRDFYRVATSVTNPVRCTIPTIDQNSEQPVTVTSSLQNISAGGVAIVDEKKILNPTIGHVYKNCRLDLPGGTPVVVTLQVKNSQEMTFSNGKSIRRLGCMFIDLPKPMLAAVQRYITKLEREQNARATGLR